MLIECVNNKNFQVKLKNIVLFYLWVLICVKVGKDVANSEVVCQSSFFSEDFTNGFTS